MELESPAADGASSDAVAETERGDEAVGEVKISPSGSLVSSRSSTISSLPESRICKLAIKRFFPHIIVNEYNFIITIRGWCKHFVLASVLY